MTEEEKKKKIRELWREARSAYRKDDYEAEKDHLLAILKINPEHAMSLNNLGVWYLEQLEYDTAKSYLEKALSVNSNHANALHNFCAMYVLLGSWHELHLFIRNRWESLGKEIEELAPLDFALWHLFYIKLLRGVLNPDDPDLDLPWLESFLREMKSKFFKQIAPQHEELGQLVIDLIALLKVYPIARTETIVAHYAPREAAHKILIDDGGGIRMSAPFKMNDKKEGITFYDYLGLDSNAVRDTSQLPFIACFSFALHSLNQFRLYGKDRGADAKEATGVSIEFNSNFFSAGMSSITHNSLGANYKDGQDATKSDGNMPEDPSVKKEEELFTLFRCVYVDPSKNDIVGLAQPDRATLLRELSSMEKVHNYDEEMRNLERVVNSKMGALKELIVDRVKSIGDDPAGTKKAQLDKALAPILAHLAPLIKHFAYHDEEECRIVKMIDMADKEDPKYISIEWGKEEKSKTPDMDIVPYIKYKKSVKEGLHGVVIGDHCKNAAIFESHMYSKYGSRVQVERQNSPHTG
jgi:hypothetical protein